MKTIHKIDRFWGDDEHDGGYNLAVIIADPGETITPKALESWAWVQDFNIQAHPYPRPGGFFRSAPIFRVTKSGRRAYIRSHFGWDV